MKLTPLTLPPLPSPTTEKVRWPAADDAGVEVWVRRLDQISGPAPGNKTWKLHLHWEKAAQTPSRTLLTFGGPWSNHLHAAAAAGSAFGIRTIGIVRGERPVDTNLLTPTLRDCEAQGMELFFISRAEYNEKNTEFFKAWLRGQFDNPWIVPEGGADAWGVSGCQSLIEPSDLNNPWDAVLVAAGTGTTAAGLAIALRGSSPLVVGHALRGFHPKQSIETLLNQTLYDGAWTSDLTREMIFWNDIHEGGFAKRSPELLDCMEHWEKETGIELDAVYTGKLVLEMQRQLQKTLLDRPKFLRPGSRVLLIHTGGLQGNRSWKTKSINNRSRS